MKKRKLLYLFPLAALLLSGCELPDFLKKKNTEPEQQQGQEEQQGGEQGGETPEVKKDFEGLSLNDATFTYDGQVHSISVEGELPQGASVDYGEAGHEFTEVGVYPVTAVISAEGYNSLTLNATLTIVKGTITGVTFVGKSVVYDGTEKKIEVVGLPEGAEVSYSPRNTYTDAGEYPVTATVTKHGFEDLVLNATLTIEKGTMEGITFENASVTYDGQPHTIAPVIPEAYAGAQVSYEGAHEFTATGTHEIHAKVTLANYKDWTGTAFLTIADAHFAGLSMQNKTVTYNGQKQTIELTGTLPEGAHAEYVEGYDGGTDPGEYLVKINISAEGYETLPLMATLTIEKATFEGIEFNDVTVAYDGEEHSIVPSIPAKYEGAEISYSAGGNKLTEIGSLEVTATVTLHGYNDWSDSATLTITPASFVGLSLEDRTVDFDGQFHTIELTGDLPDGASFNYIEGFTGGTEPGTYTVKGKVTAEHYNDLDLQATLTIEYNHATEPLMLEDFEGLTDEDLLSTPFSYDRYNDGWSDNTGDATFTIEPNQYIGNGTNTIKMGVKHDFTDYRLRRKVNVTKQYSGLALDTFVNDFSNGGTSKVTVSLMYSDLPIPDNIPNPLDPSDPIDLTWAKGEDAFVLTWKLADKMPSNWTHWEIPFDDEDNINIHNNAYTLSEFKTLMSNFNLTMESMSRYITTVAVDVKSSATGGYERVEMYADNIQLIPATSRVEEQVVDFANRSYTIRSNDFTVYKLTLGDDASKSCRFETLNLLDNVVYEGTYSSVNENLTLVVSPEGSQDTITFQMAASQNGEKMKFTAEPVPTNPAMLAPLAEHVNFDRKEFKEIINVDDFESYEATGQGYDRSHLNIEQVSGLRAAYYGEVYNDSTSVEAKYNGLIEAGKWRLINESSWKNYIELENTGRSGNCMSIYNNADWQTRYMSFDFAKTNFKAQPLGRGSNFSFFLKGSVAQTVSVKVFYAKQITMNNQGNASYYSTVTNVPVTTDWTQVNIPLEENRDVYGFMFTPTKASGRIYVDDIEMFGEGSPYTVYEASPDTAADGLYGATVNNQFIGLDLSASGTAATISKAGNVVGTFTSEMSSGRITLKDSQYAGAGLTIKIKILTSGLLIMDLSGQAADQYSSFLGLVLAAKQYANLNYDFSDKSSNASIYNDWVQEKYTSSWTTLNPSSNNNLYFKNDYGNYVSVGAGSQTTMRYTTKPASVVCGVANHFSIDIANDYSKDGNTAGNKLLKIKLYKADGSEMYLVGDANNWGYIPAGAGNRAAGQWLNLQFDFDDIEVAAIQFTVKNDKAGNDYIYFDNIKLSHETTASYKLLDNSNWESPYTIADAKAEFYAWVWDNSGHSYWIKLKLLQDQSNSQYYFNVKLPNTMTGMKILRFNPNAQTKPTIGLGVYGTYNTNPDDENRDIWNDSGDIVLNGTGGSINFAM